MNGVTVQYSTVQYSKKEEDIPSAHRSGCLPILDLEVWVEKKEGEKQEILFSYYSKPMASKDIIIARSAFTVKEKKNILLEL